MASYALLCAGCAVPGAAFAHSPIPGIGRFYSGMLHPLLVPAQLLALLALGLLIGQRGMARSRIAIGLLLLAVVGGLGIGYATRDVDSDTLLLGCCALLALAVVLARPLPQWTIATAALGVGSAIGLSSAPDGLTGWAHLGSLAGTAFGSFLLLIWVAVMIESAQRPWLKIIVRVLGSWLAASALLVLALTWIGPRKGVLSGAREAEREITVPSLRADPSAIFAAWRPGGDVPNR